MWENPDSDGCLYDTTDCNHLCKGCQMGVNSCQKCNEYVFWPNKICEYCQEELDEDL